MFREIKKPDYDEIRKDITDHNHKEVKGFFGPYRWLSNFYPAVTKYQFATFPTSENAYQFAKAKTATPEFMQKMIHCSAGESKRIGQTVKLRPDWDEVRVALMFDIIYDKFNRNDDLYFKLINTGNKYLEETNDWGDQFWGVCDGYGQNMLGFVLMEVRSALLLNRIEK